ncbi:23S rRNA (pseudouridine(1915)-N(3))-methyltransferase RlmH [Gynuella sp.]|uniref:23S rRNA (pseudouridine(1915)-N(3))-methyltransferase RlmH n=1 Tax=Gynuella sp. TaxID=2969146 RepID=UPI003D09969C
MKIRCLAIGTRMPAWVYQGVEEYTKRLPRDFSLEFVELPLGYRGKNTDKKTAMAAEAKSIRDALQTSDKIIALDVKGRSWSTEKLAQQAEQWRQDGHNLAILVGGPDGLDSELLQQAQLRWSLSELTLPHPMVRLILAEQLYRAWTILMNHPYHK